MPQIILMEGRLLGLGPPSTRSQGRPPCCVTGPRGLLPVLGGVQTLGSGLGPCGREAGAQKMQRDGLCRGGRSLEALTPRDPGPRGWLTMAGGGIANLVTEKLSGHQLQSPGVGQSRSRQHRTLASSAWFPFASCSP